MAESTARRDFETTGWLLGMAGLIPFISLPLVVLVLGNENAISAPLVNAFRAYSIIILSFLGGIRWGEAILRADQPETQATFDTRSLIVSVVPSLIGWASIFFPAAPALGLLLIGFCAQGAWDSFSAQSARLPAWFGKLRIFLTIIVASCHVLLLMVVLAA